MKRKRVMEFFHARRLHIILFEFTPEDWSEFPPGLRAQCQRTWDLLRKLEEYNLSEKAEFFRIAIFGSLVMSALGSAAMIILMVLSNGLSVYNNAITSFETQMISMLMLHFFFLIWRAFWVKKLKWLGLSIPVELE